MAAMVSLPHRGQVVGALACQKDSYLRFLETEVVSCVKAPSAPSDSIKKKKKAVKEQDTPPSDSWLIEFSDSVLFPEGTGSAC
jgi:misacylated tRNA(Ala) deacylase